MLTRPDRGRPMRFPPEVRPRTGGAHSRRADGTPQDHRVRHDASRRRAVDRSRVHPRREGRDRATARAAGRGRDRGRLPRGVRGGARRRACGRGRGARAGGRGDGAAGAGGSRRGGARARGRAAFARPHRARVERSPSRAEAPAHPRGGGRARALGRRLLANAVRRGAVLLRGRVALRSGVPRRAVRRRDRRGRERHQSSRHRRLRRAGAVRRPAPRGARALSRAGDGDGGGALPRRPRACDGKHPRRRRSGSGPDRVHDERPRRARRQRGARGGRQRARRPPRRARRRDGDRPGRAGGDVTARRRR